MSMVDVDKSGNVTAAEIIAEARSWVGTPFRHQARIKGLGVDCAGLIVCVAQALGLAIEDVTGYAREPKPSELMRILDEQLVRVAEPAPGDVLMLVMDVDPQHLGFLASPESRVPSPANHHTIIHAHEASDPRISKVIEHRYDEHWRRRTVGAWRFRELAPEPLEGPSPESRVPSPAA